MELREILRQRRMVRNYLPEPVPREVLERIVATVRRAPSGGYSQGQRLVVVTDPALRAAIARLAGEEESLAEGFEPWISRAPVHVVVLAREEDYHERYRKPDKLHDGDEIVWPVPYWYVDAGAALMLLLLAAIDEGLAAGVFGLARRPGRAAAGAARRPRRPPLRRRRHARPGRAGPALERRDEPHDAAAQGGRRARPLGALELIDRAPLRAGNRHTFVTGRHTLVRFSGVG